MHWLYLILLTDNLHEISMKDAHHIPKYLTMSVGKSFLRLKFNFISP